MSSCLTSIIILLLIISKQTINAVKPVLNNKNYPYQVSLRIYNKHICGGTIISLKYILTAAQCCYINDITCPVEAKMFRVFVGHIFLEPSCESVSRKVKKIFVYEEYGLRWREHNLAVLQLMHTLPIMKYIKPVPINKSYNVSHHALCVVTGWHFSDEYGDQLQKIITTIEHQKYCLNVTNRTMDGEICTKSLTCDGDLGGPLVCNKKLYGVYSYRNCGYYSGFVHVANYTNWIISVVAEDKANNFCSNTLLIVCYVILFIAQLG